MTEADRLVAGNWPGPEHRGLGVLLDAAAAPPSVEELTGEAAAVARFVAAYRGTVVEPPARERVRVRRSIGMAAVKVAAGVAVLAAGGTAVAAETGSLPAGVQHFFSALGVPAPAGGPQPTATGAGTAAPTGAASPSPTPAPSSGRATTTATPPAESAALGLCRAWDDARNDPHGEPMPAASRRVLAAAAGGENGIAHFCAGLLAGSATPTGSQPSTATSSSPSSSTSASANAGNAGGNGNGDNGDGGDGGGDGGGSSKVPPEPPSIPTPTPTPTASDTQLS